ncbi:hypothetical protein GOP47_0004524 [Adiantum capillus-veneris]|uniref:Uncharacterized protein n=1 Tax=Adiantum capillus-veneris TaxID=13818 RepID=A0A9D4ZPS3_ADICA|nr:hypothetical protein GOP47_0004524 [Adiantum capillus-veneris]
MPLLGPVQKPLKATKLPQKEVNKLSKVAFLTYSCHQWQDGKGASVYHKNKAVSLLEFSSQCIHQFLVAGEGLLQLHYRNPFSFHIGNPTPLSISYSSALPVVMLQVTLSQVWMPCLHARRQSIRSRTFCITAGHVHMQCMRVS